VHLVGLAFDSWVHIGLRQMLVPFTSDWNPVAVSWGVVGLYLLVAIELTSLLRSRLPKRFWKGVHLSSYGLYVIATVHMLTAGTDAGSKYLQWAAVAATAVIVFFTAYRVMGPDKAGSVQGGRPSNADRLAAARAEAARHQVGTAPG
jgi:DMSO/TMAO reductase YedYZ heme-binding membrane subunit